VRVVTFVGRVHVPDAVNVSVTRNPVAMGLEDPSVSDFRVTPVELVMFDVAVNLIVNSAH
jgi:hypothetical protein